MLVVPKHITLSDMIDILYEEFHVDKLLYRLMLEVHYRTESPWFPVIEIQNDNDLSVFISETSKTKLPLCVSRLKKKRTVVVNQLKKDKTHVVTKLKKDESDVDKKRQKVISRICVKFWEKTLLHVPHVKHLKDDKVKHNTTIELLRLICKEVDRTYTSNGIIERLYSSPFCLAVENNTDEAIEVLTTYFPQSYWFDKDGQNIFQLTVLNRSEKVYSYILHHGRNAKFRFSISEDADGNNILHLAGRLSPMHKLASRPALQMQKELQWFEEVKRVVGTAHTRALNKNKETPMTAFRKQHKELRKDGEEWMKKTADSYTITATLIITIVFAAAITVPGGTDDKTGKPIYEMKPSFIIFAVADAISLFTATTSLLSFLYILTARYNWNLSVRIERCFLSQKNSGVGRGFKEKDTSVSNIEAVKEKDLNDEPLAMEVQSPLVDQTNSMKTGGGSYPPLPTQGTNPTGNTPRKSSYVNVIGESSKKTVNICTLITPRGMSTNGLNSMLENGPWYIRNHPLILRKWNPYVDLLKEDVRNVPMWVKLHGVPVTASSQDEGFYGNSDYDEDPYDDDMYESQDLSQEIQAICDNLDIRVRGRKNK
nr:ankyrin repeat family protein [Tanacetum cinerariifolium]